MSEAEESTAASLIHKLSGIKESTVGGMPIIIAPSDFSVHKFPELMQNPQRITKNVTAHDLQGFIDYTKAFKVESTALFAALLPKPKLHAILDYHQIGLPSHCTHHLFCDMEHAEEWKRWTANNKKGMNQKEFGTFLEDNLKDVQEPNGADLLNMALNFSSLRSVEFKSSQRLSDGLTQVHYVEEDKAASLKMPDKITLGIPVFKGETAYKIAARLKLLIKDGLTLWYELERPDMVVDAAYAKVIEKLESATGISVFRGAV